VNPADADLGELIKKREKEEKDTRDDLDKARNESGLPPKNCTSIN